MSDVTPHTFTDSLVSRYLDSNPGLRDAYLNDVSTFHQVNLLRRFLEAADRGMRREGVPDESRARVLEGITLPSPEARYERNWLLSRFDPAEFGGSPATVFTELGPDFSLRDELTAPPHEEEDVPPCPA